MATDCCPGYEFGPFASLVRDYPGASVYPAADFRVEWGPIFHRGRLDGSARLLVIGQDPAANETFVRRILVGVAGQRTQGLIRRLGYTRSYVLVNTFLYSVYGQGGGNRHAADAAIAAYRERWIDAILAGGRIEAVIALGRLADRAWSLWRTHHPHDPHRDLPYRHVTHPTQPDSASGGNTNRQATLTRALLENWTAALTALHGAIQHPDVATPLVPYGNTWASDDLVAIPAGDLPPGIPQWMRDQDRWAQRAGASAASKRANLTVTVPATALTTAPHVAPVRAAGLHEVGSAGADPPHGVALRGTVVTMATPAKVLADHVVWIRGGTIADIRPATDPAPAGFEGVRPLATGGLLFPGLIDLHNHLAYNVLPLWSVPKRFTNRDQWSGLTAYHRNVSAPMSAIARLPGLLAAICRYVECKSIMGGATTSQGIKLVNQAGITTFFRGLLRNVELTDDPGLPSASARIGDVAAKDEKAFLAALKREKTCYLLHLSEGTDDAARAHFLALHEKARRWAITPVLSGIHCVALRPEDFHVMAGFGASMVWSPTSNLLLYGGTSDVAAARKAGLRIGLGPDWSPSGSKNMLGELKTARLYSVANGDLLSDEEIVAMATRDAAAILRWDTAGTLEAGKVADLLVIPGSARHPYQALIEAAETDIRLVMIGGVARYGASELMRSLVPELEEVAVGKTKRAFNLAPNAPAGHDQPTLESLALAEATRRLEQSLANLKDTVAAARHLDAIALDMNGGWRLGLDETEDHGAEMRPRFGLTGAGRRAGPTRPRAASGPAAASIVLDPLTVADDRGYLASMASQKNLPGYVAKKLRSLYA